MKKKKTYRMTDEAITLLADIALTLGDVPDVINDEVIIWETDANDSAILMNLKEKTVYSPWMPREHNLKLRGACIIAGWDLEET